MGDEQTTSRRADRDWTAGPAKWAAIIVLGGFAIGGMLWSISTWPDRRRAAESPPADLRIDINADGVTRLQLVPGLGPALAEAIVEDRESRGPFSSIDELDRVPGIGARTIEAIRPYIRAGG